MKVFVVEDSVTMRIIINNLKDSSFDDIVEA